MDDTKQFNWSQNSDPNSVAYLRPVQSYDAEEFIDLVNDSHDFLQLWVNPPSDLNTFHAAIEQSKDDGSILLLVCMTSDQRITGSINISQIVFGKFCSAYIGYWIAKEYAGRGLMTSALQNLIHLALGPFGLHRLEANIQPANTPSKKLVASIGFQKEGLSPKYLKIKDRWEDHERWAIRAENLPLSPRSSSDS